MAERVLMKGNEAIAEAAIRAGCRHYFGYPITPQTEIAAYMAKKMPKIGGVFLQAESEIASINMVYGAAAAGVRVMTSSSSPGISLKAEGLSYIAGSDVPALVVNVQRGGPGLGGIQPSQSERTQQKSCYQIRSDGRQMKKPCQSGKQQTANHRSCQTEQINLHTKTPLRFRNYRRIISRDTPNYTPAQWKMQDVYLPKN